MAIIASFLASVWITLYTKLKLLPQPMTDSETQVKTYPPEELLKLKVSKRVIDGLHQYLLKIGLPVSGLVQIYALLTVAACSSSRCCLAVMIFLFAGLAAGSLWVSSLGRVWFILWFSLALVHTAVVLLGLFFCCAIGSEVGRERRTSRENLVGDGSEGSASWMRFKRKPTLNTSARLASKRNAIATKYSSIEFSQ